MLSSERHTIPVNPWKRIMSDYGIKQTTVINHLLKYLLEGNVVRSDGLLTLSKIPPDKMPLVIKAFKRLGTEFLKPVFDAFDGEFDYDELHIVRLYSLIEYGQEAV